MTELEAKQAAPDFWSVPGQANQVVQQLRRLRTWTNPVVAAESKAEELAVLAELAAEEEDAEAAGEVATGVRELEELIAQLDFQFLLNGPEDGRGAILEIHPGAGGIESQDWAEMLLRMYVRYLDRHGMKHTTLDLQPAEEAGLKSVSLEVDHPFAYGYLKSETGVHRLVRKSPFNAAGSRETSFASLFVYPEVDESIEIEINPADVRTDTYRASGAGGQHINKTDSAVRLTHVPTGIVVQCQNDRSQHRNRDEAWAMLRSRLYEHEMRKQREAQQQLEDSKTDVGWGHQIRSYVLDSSRIKDLRTSVETANTQKVLDGDLDMFIEASLKQGL